MEESEKSLLLSYCKEFKGKSEFNWADKFVKSDILTAFKRSRTSVSQLLQSENADDRIDVLSEVWEVTKTKGFITQMEASFLLGVSRDWNLESELIAMVKSN